MKTASVGSVSSGTMRPEDLIPAFCDELKYYAKMNRNKKDLALIEEIENRMYDDEGETKEGYFDSDEVDYDLDELFERLDAYAPAYAYFGSHPGDGADYGFWLSEFFDEEFDGLKVSDTSEVPKGYTGEVLEINDHRNITLYAAKKGRLTEIWGLV